MDTPHIGNDEKTMTGFVEEYLRNSVGFVHVMTNTVNVSEVTESLMIHERALSKYVFVLAVSSV